MPDLTTRILILAAWICFFCGETSTGSGSCTNPKCGV